jgi:hypothetical protein
MPKPSNDTYAWGRLTFNYSWTVNFKHQFKFKLFYILNKPCQFRNTGYWEDVNMERLYIDIL